jgi:hypothetical protein
MCSGDKTALRVLIMQVHGFDERHVVCEGIGGNFVVFIYEGGEEHPGASVDTYLLTDADLPGVLRWLQEALPINSCWSLGVVGEPASPTPESPLRISWIVGADVLNMAPGDRDPREQGLADEMLARRHGVGLA